MKQAPRQVQVATGAGFAVSYAALLWLFSFRPNHFVIADRLGYASAVFSALAVLCVCWAAIFALVVLKMKWPVQACRWAGVALLIPCSVFLFETATGGYSALVLIVCQATLTSYACRKFAFPAVSDEDAMRSEPLPTMFPK
jgi:hypothetical protein